MALVPIVGSIGPDGRLTLTIDSSTGTYRLVQPMQKPIHRKTSNSYQYEYVADVSAVTHVTLSVRATNDAHIALSAGGAGDNRHALRNRAWWGGTTANLSSAQESGPLPSHGTRRGTCTARPERHRRTLLGVMGRWRAAVLWRIHGQQVGRAQIMSVSMAQAGITAPLRHLLVSTGFGSTGEWQVWVN